LMRIHFTRLVDNPHYSTAFASSDPPILHNHEQSLRFAVPCGSCTGFPRSVLRSTLG